MYRKDLTLIENIFVLDKIKAQAHNTRLRELDKLIGTSKTILIRLENSEKSIREQWEKLNGNKSAPVNRKIKRKGEDPEVDKTMNEWFSLCYKREALVCYDSALFCTLWFQTTD